MWSPTTAPALGSASADEEAALARFISELPRLRQAGKPRELAEALCALGRAHVRLAEWDAAEACFEETAAAAVTLCDTGLEGAVALGAGEMHLLRRNLPEARARLETAAAILGSCGMVAGLAEALKLLAVLSRRANDHELAHRQLREALSAAETSGSTSLEAEIHSERALLLMADGRHAEALRDLNRAHALFLELRMGPEVQELERRLAGLELIYFQLVKAWGESIESKDHYTAGHCERVAHYACELAEAIGFRGGDLEWLRLGAFLHDVGKTAIPPEILNKPGKLTEAEWALMKTHTVVGDRMTAELQFPWDVRPIVRNHHEHWDGGGYPDGLAGEQIPLTARILCVADVYDALTTTRSYRPALSSAEAVGIMARDSGRIFDPSLFDLFSRIIRERQQ